jgi:hypothetical protein
MTGQAIGVFLGTNREARTQRHGPRYQQPSFHTHPCSYPIGVLGPLACYTPARSVLRVQRPDPAPLAKPLGRLVARLRRVTIGAVSLAPGIIYFLRVLELKPGDTGLQLGGVF